MSKRFLATAVTVVAAAGVTALMLSSVAGGSTRGAQVLPSSSCGPLYYQGSGKPQLIIASDLPLQGAGRAQNLAMQKAIQYVLSTQYHFKAGKFTVGYQGCDDSTAQTGAWDAGKCSSNARAYAADKTVIAVLGTFNSGCSKLIVPILNRAPGGSLAMMSVANTSVGLTHFAPWNDPGEPKIYYPTGKRNYARLAASDDYQGPAAADLLKKLTHVKSVYVIHDNQTFGKGVANAFKLRAAALGIKVLGFEPWDPKATDYTAIGQHIKDSGAQSVYLGGLVCNNGVKLLKDLRSVLGSKPVFVGPDGWTPYSATLGAGSAAQGMYVSYAGLPLESLGANGKKFITAFGKYLKQPKGELPPPYSIYQAQAAQIMLDAISHSDGTRTSVVNEMFKAKVTNGIMGTFHLNKDGDIVPIKAISFDKLVGKTGKYAFVVITKVKG
ncbi:MAG: branched-chain amino acid ABC transporter substrate-binding protein [Gaiellaceae bacterium]